MSAGRSHRIVRQVIERISNEPLKTASCRALKSPTTGARNRVRMTPWTTSADISSTHTAIALSQRMHHHPSTSHRQDRARARRMTWFVVEPKISRSRVCRPCTPLTIRSTDCSAAIRRISRYGLPSVTSVAGGRDMRRSYGIRHFSAMWASRSRWSRHSGRRMARS